MNNSYKIGDEFPYTNSGSAISGGAVVAIGDVIGIAASDILANSTGTVVVSGVFRDVAKTTSQVWGQGAKLYWNPSTSKFTTAADDGGSPAVAFVFAGWAYFAALSADTTGYIKLKVS